MPRFGNKIVSRLSPPRQKEHGNYLPFTKMEVSSQSDPGSLYYVYKYLATGNRKPLRFIENSSLIIRKDPVIIRTNASGFILTIILMKLKLKHDKMDQLNEYKVNLITLKRLN